MKKFQGEVISVKMAKTAVIGVTRGKAHPFYKKKIKTRKKYHAHDEIGVKVGDMVRFVETRPISKTKRWEIVEVIKK